MTREFITALQFLTRIRLFRDPDYDDGLFGRSVKFFPLIGLLAGSILAGVAVLTGGWLPGTVRSTLLVTLSVFITGGLHCDGLMDSADGLFSGRSRERMLEIMKDSRVGSFGVIAIFLLLLWKWALLHDLPDSLLGPALISMMTFGRFAMILAILYFPYARPEGMGKAFALNAGTHSLGPALATLLGLLAAFYVAKGLLVCAIAAVAALAAILFAGWFGRWTTHKLGGMTGDTYGAVAELAELVVLTVFVLSTFAK
jgi:adenosylcobinamide-GDP ribazoletransferase